MKRPRFAAKFRDACRTVAEQCYGRKGIWAYEAFEHINAAYFGRRLPHPLILWGLTPHGNCIAWNRTARDKSRPPIVNLHPSLLGGTEKIDPWGINPAWLGPSVVFDVLLHECIHIHVEYNLGGSGGRSSHDGPVWMRQANRIAPLLGFSGIRMGGTKCKRVPDPTAPRTVRGKVATRVQRVSTGNVPMIVAAGFPMSLRTHLQRADPYYRTRELPPDAPSYR